MAKVPIRQFKNFNGITKKTMEHIQMDAGAVFKNFDIETDTYETAKAAGKLLFATQGGNEFSAAAEFRHLEIDGKRSQIKGDAFIDNWVVTLKTTTIETTVEAIKNALGVASTDTSEIDGYTKITGENYILDDDYLDNVTWIGRIKGSEKPIIIQVLNAMSESGLTYTVADKGNATIETTFTANGDIDDYESDNVSAPFAIYYPTSNSTVVTASTGNTNTTTTTEESE